MGAISSVLAGGIPPNTEVAGAGWMSLAGAATEGGGPNNGLPIIPEPAPEIGVLLVLAEDASNNGNVDAGFVASGPTALFSFSPSHRGFSTSFVGVACAEMRFGCCETTESGLLRAAEFAKKLGTLPVGGGVTDAGLANAVEFAKKLGMLDPACSAGATETGLLSADELEKLGIPDAVEGTSVTVALTGSGVEVVREIDGSSDGVDEAEGCAKKEDIGLGGCSCSLEAKGVGAACALGALVSENGNAAMGGSLAVVRSCWIRGVWNNN